MSAARSAWLPKADSHQLKFLKLGTVPLENQRDGVFNMKNYYRFHPFSAMSGGKIAVDFNYWR